MLVASTESGVLASPLVESEAETMTAQQKSIGMSQSNRQNGSVIIRAFR